MREEQLLRYIASSKEERELLDMMRRYDQAVWVGRIAEALRAVAERAWDEGQRADDGLPPWKPAQNPYTRA